MIPAEVERLLRASPAVQEFFTEQRGEHGWTAHGPCTATWLVTVGDGVRAGWHESGSLRESTLCALDKFAEALAQSARSAERNQRMTPEARAQSAGKFARDSVAVGELRARVADLWKDGAS